MDDGILPDGILGEHVHQQDREAMPKTPSPVVVWIPEQGAYALHERQTGDQSLFQDAAQWLAWLDTQRSFSFHGAHWYHHAVGLIHVAGKPASR